MKRLRYWLQNIYSLPREDYWVDFRFYNDSDSLSFDVSNVSEIIFEINGRRVLPCSGIAGLREFCELMKDENILISFSGDRITIESFEEMKRNHISIRALCPKRVDLKIYQSVTMDL